jgi:hypothetical protein
MSSLSTVIYPDIIREISATLFNNTFLPVGGPLLQPCRLIKFLNNTNVAVSISWDGVNTHDFLPAGGFLLLDIATNKENASAFDIQTGTQFYVAGLTGTGNFFISNYFGK